VAVDAMKSVPKWNVSPLLYNVQAVLAAFLKAIVVGAVQLPQCCCCLAVFRRASAAAVAAVADSSGTIGGAKGLCPTGSIQHGTAHRVLQKRLQCLLFSPLLLQDPELFQYLVGTCLRRIFRAIPFLQLQASRPGLPAHAWPLNSCCIRLLEVLLPLRLPLLLLLLALLPAAETLPQLGWEKMLSAFGE